MNKMENETKVTLSVLAILVVLVIGGVFIVLASSSKNSSSSESQNSGNNQLMPGSNNGGTGKTPPAGTKPKSLSLPPLGPNGPDKEALKKYIEEAVKSGEMSEEQGKIFLEQLPNK